MRDGVAYVIAATTDGHNFDVFRTDGTAPAVSIGAPPLPGRHGNNLANMYSLVHGVAFRGYDGAYREYVYDADAPSPAVHVLDFEAGATELSRPVLFRGMMCGTPGSSGRLVCYDGRPQPDGVLVIGGTGLNMTDACSIGDERFCFRATYSSAYQIFCSDGVNPPTRLPDHPDGFPSAGWDGDLYFICDNGRGVCRFDFDTDTQSTVDSVAHGYLNQLVALPNQDALVYIHDVNEERSLRSYHPSTGATEDLVINVDGGAAPRRFAVVPLFGGSCLDDPP